MNYIPGLLPSSLSIALTERLFRWDEEKVHQYSAWLLTQVQEVKWLHRCLTVDRLLGWHLNFLSPTQPAHCLKHVGCAFQLYPCTDLSCPT